VLSRKKLFKLTISLQMDPDDVQGSSLGPLLFILCINYIVFVIQHCTINLFVDDTLIYLTGKNLQDMEEKLNMDLVVVTRSLKANKLILNLNLNITKFQIISITHQNTNQATSVQVTNDQNHLEKVKAIKYLGVCTYRQQIEFQ
jgi:Reverse transcriptase (RNA-dependent DNA polymerase)